MTRTGLTVACPSRRSVLIVEDDVDMAVLYHDALQGRFSVTIARGLEDARRILAGSAAPFDAVVLNMWLPNRCGLDLVRDISLLTPACPVVVVSAKAFDQEELKCAGAASFLLNPFSLDDLVAAVIRAMAGEQVRREFADRDAALASLRQQCDASDAAIRRALAGIGA